MDVGFIDLQVNGYAGVDFNQDDLDAEKLHLACDRLSAEGVSAILATVITEEISIMEARLRQITRLRGADPLAQRLIAGIHIEGPFLNPAPGYRGAHPEDAICPADVDGMKRLLDAAEGLTRIVTLAPENDDNLTVTRYLANEGIIVAAGHCDPSRDVLDAAIDAGLSMFTHLGNGCPMQMARHDNIIQRALSRSERLTICFIADGVHIPFFALKNYLKIAGIERSVIVTDAIAAAGLGPGRYRLSRWEVVVGDDGAARAPDNSHLVGAAVTMQQSADNLRDHVGLTEHEVARLTKQNPSSLIFSSGYSQKGTIAL
jgi:N-acetylglucosamine-6-phosphate deacetylase